jgi:hypothetical protein
MAVQSMGQNDSHSNDMAPPGGQLRFQTYEITLLGVNKKVLRRTIRILVADLSVSYKASLYLSRNFNAWVPVFVAGVPPPRHATARKYFQQYALLLFLKKQGNPSFSLTCAYPSVLGLVCVIPFFSPTGGVLLSLFFGMSTCSLRVVALVCAFVAWVHVLKKVL